MDLFPPSLHVSYIIELSSMKVSCRCEGNGTPDLLLIVPQLKVEVGLRAGGLRFYNLI